MYQSFHISNFRCFEELQIDKFERVNLVTGLNNVGKTALLEALFLHAGAYNPDLALRVDAFRGLDRIKYETGNVSETPWDRLFFRFDNSKVIQFTGAFDGVDRRIVRLKVVKEPQEVIGFTQVVRQISDAPEALPATSEASQILELQFERIPNVPASIGKYFLVLDREGLRTVPSPPSPPFQTFFIQAGNRMPLAEAAERYGNLDEIGLQDIVLDILRIIEPRLHRLSVRVLAGVPILHGDLGIGKLTPLALAGEGMNRLASLVLAIGNARGGLVLIDEIENGLHYSILPKVWAAIGEASRRFDAQVIATTHSLECITAAHKAFSEFPTYDFRLHRLEKIKDKIDDISYDQNVLDAAIHSMLEVR